MRRTAGGAVALVLLLAGCGEDVGTEQVPDPGPLRLVATGTPCASLHDGAVEWAGIVLDNTAEIPLTVDAVALTLPRNVLLTEVLLSDAGVPAERREQVSAIDATVQGDGHRGHRMQLTLRLRAGAGSEPSTFTGLQLDYHNVEGAFRVETEQGLAFTRTCTS